MSIEQAIEAGVDVEAGHEAVIQAEIDALTVLGFWFDYTEYRFDG